MVSVLVTSILPMCSKCTFLGPYFEILELGPENVFPFSGSWCNIRLCWVLEEH